MLALTRTISLLRYKPRSVWNVSRANTAKFRAAMAAMRRGTANCNIAFVGDSTTRGTGAGVTTAAFPNAYPRKVSDLLATAGISSGWQNIFASGNVILPNFDSRTTGGANVGVNNTLGGGIRQLTGAGTITFTPTANCDTFDIYYVTTSGAGSSTVNLDGGATLATLNHNQASAVRKTSVTGTLGAHTVNIVWVSGAVYIVGVDAYNSASKQATCWNFGASGAKAADVADAVLGYAELNALGVFAPHLTFINIGINDWTAATTVATFKSNLQIVIDKARVSGDVIIQTPVPSAVGSASLATQQLYIDALFELAIANAIPLIDIWRAWGSYEVMQPLGNYSDALHPNAQGYLNVATTVANAIWEIDRYGG